MFVFETARAQMIVTVDSNATSLAQTLAGPGVTVSNATLTCTGIATGTFSAIPATLPIGQGVVLTSGRATDVLPPNNYTGTTWNNQVGADPDLNALDPFSFAGNYDACALEFDMFVTDDTVSFDYIFASEEYNEWVNSQYNDVFAFFISGPGITGLQNIALVPGTNERVRINTINCDTNSQYYICNNLFDPFANVIYGSDCGPGICPADSFPWLLEYDGFTTVLKAVAGVQACNTYHLKLAIQDNSDPFLDAGVFIRRNSISSGAVMITAEVDYTDQLFGNATAVEGCINGRFKIELTDPSTNPFVVDLFSGGTATDGVDYQPINTTVTFAPGDTVEYIDINVIADGLVDPNETVFLYQLSPCTGLPIDTTVLYITDNFNAQAAADTGICQGETVFLYVNGGAGVTYAWSPASGLTCTDCQYPFATPLANTTYTVVITSTGGCTATDEVEFNISPSFSFAGNDTSTCGYSMSLSGSDAMGTPSIWSLISAPVGGVSVFSDSTSQTTSVVVSLAGIYKYTYTVGNFCQNTDTITVYFNDPDVSISPADTGVCPGSCVTLSAVTNGAPATYSVNANLPIPDDDWNGIASTVEVAGHCLQTIQNNWTIANVTVNVDHDWDDDVKLSLIAPDGEAILLTYNNGGSGDDFTNTIFTTTASTSIASGTAPFTGEFQPQQPFGWLAGSPLNGTWTLLATDLWAGNTGTLLNWSITFNTNTYAWSPSAGLSATDVANPEACPTNPTTYTLIVTNDCGCNDTTTAFINTSGGLQTEIIITDASCNQSNGSASATVASGTSPYTYTWSNGDTSSTANNLPSGTYIVTVSDATGCNSIDTALVGTSGGPLVVATITNASCGQIDGSIELDISGGTLPYNLIWSNGETTDDLFNAPPDSYSVTVADSNGCSSTFSYDILEDSCTGTLTITLGVSGGCDTAGSFIDVTATGTAPFTFSWSNGATSEDLTATTTGTYIVTVSDAGGEIVVDSVNITISLPPSISVVVQSASCNQFNGNIDVTTSGNAPLSFSWNNGFTGEDLTNVGAGTYSLTVTDTNGCSSTIDTTVSTTAAPDATFVVTDPACGLDNGSIDVNTNGGTTPYTFSWSNGLTSEDLFALTAGSYSLTITDANNCSVSFDTTLVQLNAPVLQLNGLVDSLCVGQSFAVTASGYTDYTWTPNSGLSNTTGDSAIVSPTASITYIVVGQNNNCSDTATFSVTVVPAAVVSFVDTFSGCGLLTVTLFADVQNANNVQWWIDDELISTENPATVTLEQGLHNALVVAESPLGCNDTVVVNSFANIFSFPVAAFETTTIDSSLYSFTNNSTGATSYLWDFGDGSIDTVTNPQHTFMSFGSYNVILTAVNEQGCTDTAQAAITVNATLAVFIPNTFTPNGDGVNDYFKVYGSGILTYRLQVFNRWGERVFDADGTEPLWDGTFKSKPLNTSTFVYVVDATYVDGSRVRYFGDVNLLR